MTIKIGNNKYEMVKTNGKRAGTLTFKPNEINASAETLTASKATKPEVIISPKIETGKKVKKTLAVRSKNSNWEEASKKLKKLKEMLDQGLITKEDYQNKKSELLANF